jgi:hypothetical protein
MLPSRSGMAANRRDGLGAVIIGVGLILLGAYFLFRQYVPQLDLDRIWPVILIALGILLLLTSLRRTRP